MVADKKMTIPEPVNLAGPDLFDPRLSVFIRGKVFSFTAKDAKDATE